jgi:hypothetical protein
MQVKIHAIRYYRVRCSNAHKPYTSIYKRDKQSQYLENNLRRGYQKTGSFKEKTRLESTPSSRAGGYFHHARPALISSLPSNDYLK